MLLCHFFRRRAVFRKAQTSTKIKISLGPPTNQGHCCPVEKIKPKSYSLGVMNLPQPAALRFKASWRRRSTACTLLASCLLLDAKGWQLDPSRPSGPHSVCRHQESMLQQSHWARRHQYTHSWRPEHYAARTAVGARRRERGSRSSDVCVGCNYLTESKLSCIYLGFFGRCRVGTPVLKCRDVQGEEEEQPAG